MSPRFPELGHVHVEDIQSVEEVNPDRRAALSAVKSRFGRRDQADIRLQRGRPTNPLELSFLDHTEELDVHGGGELTDFIQEQSARARPARSVQASAIGAGAGAALVIE